MRVKVSRDVSLDLCARPGMAVKIQCEVVSDFFKETKVAIGYFHRVARARGIASSLIGKFLKRVPFVSISRQRHADPGAERRSRASQEVQKQARRKAIEDACLVPKPYHQRVGRVHEVALLKSDGHSNHT